MTLRNNNNAQAFDFNKLSLDNRGSLLLASDQKDDLKQFLKVSRTFLFFNW
jgi:hypothetical protein